MIKITRKDTALVQQAIAYLNEAKIKEKSYAGDVVVQALHEAFYSKCYLCENRYPSAYHIDHFKPKSKHPELKYAWNNLFLACSHCNMIKGSSDDELLDCNNDSVDEFISFRVNGVYRDENYVCLQACQQDNNAVINNTIALLNNIYRGTTTQNEFAAYNLRHNLADSLYCFNNLLEDYDSSEDDDKQDVALAVKEELKDSAPFAAFKRWLIRDNESYSCFLNDF